MNTVLIAEDELLIRMALESSIPWKEFNFEVVASVADGKKAWAAYQQYRPDVVLTDILMPGLDGIELIKRIRQQDAVCKIIVITCVEHFDILYKSLNLNITDYLLKSSMTRDNLFLMVSRLKSELSCSDSAEQRSDSIDLSTNDNLRLYLIERSISLQKFLSSTSTSFSAGNLYCLYVLQCGYLNSMIRQSLINIVQEHLSPKGELYTVFSN
jgi:YesN/AraC family two-component response regulator